MKPEPTSAAVGRRLSELAADRNVTLSGLSRMIGRPSGYLTRFVRNQMPVRLAPEEITQLATFFGVEQWELGGHIGPRDR